MAAAQSHTDTLSIPPDRGHIATEQRHREAARLDAMSVDQCVALMVDDHQQVHRAVDAARPSIARFITELIPRVQQGGRLIYLGAGTSGRLGVLDASECPPTFQSDPGQVIGIIAGGDAALRRSSEGMEDDPGGAGAALQELHLADRDTVLGIAAGGTTPYVLGGLQIAARAGAMTGLLTCSPAPELVAAFDHCIVLETGPEILTGSTRLKAGSATKLVLNIITTTLFVQRGKVYSNLMVDVRATNGKLTDRAIRILCELCPELERDQAAALLHAADGQLKTAIVMQRLGIRADAARRTLDDHDGRLRTALESMASLPIS